MKIKYVVPMVFIIIALFIITPLVRKPKPGYEAQQITLQSLPFGFSDINMNEPPDKLYNIYSDVSNEGELPYYAESLEFSCIQYRNFFTLLNPNDTIAYYLFYAGNMIKKDFTIKDGGKLLNYIKTKLTEEFGQPGWSRNMDETTAVPNSKISESPSPSALQVTHQYKWDKENYLIDVSTVSHGDIENIEDSDLQISFTAKDNFLVKLANTELESRIKDIANLRFDKICSFYNDYSIGNIAGNWALLDQNKKEAVIYKGFDVYDYSYAQYGLLVLRNKRLQQDSSHEHLYRFADTNGKILIDNVKYYKRSPDGNTIVAVRWNKKYNIANVNCYIVYIQNSAYNVVPTSFEAIGYFSDDGYAHAFSGYNQPSLYKLIDKQGSIIDEYRGNSILGYFNGSTLMEKHKHSGEWYYVIADRYGNTLTKDENNRNHDDYIGIKPQIFEKYGLLTTRVVKDGKACEIIVENSRGEVIFRDNTVPLSYIEELDGVLRVIEDTKETYYDHNGKLIDGVTQSEIIPMNPYFINTQPYNDRAELPSIIKEYTLMGELNFTGFGDFYYTHLKTSKGDLLYSCKSLLHAFPEEYELDTSKCLYDDGNILFAARNKILGKYGVVDIKGRLVFDFKYDNIQSIVAADTIQIGDNLFYTNGTTASPGLGALEYRYNSAITKDDHGFYALDLSGKPIIKNIKIIE